MLPEVGAHPPRARLASPGGGRMGRGPLAPRWPCIRRRPSWGPCCRRRTAWGPWSHCLGYCQNWFPRFVQFYDENVLMEWVHSVWMCVYCTVPGVLRLNLRREGHTTHQQSEYRDQSSRSSSSSLVSGASRASGASVRASLTMSLPFLGPWSRSVLRVSGLRGDWLHSGEGRSWTMEIRRRWPAYTQSRDY